MAKPFAHATDVQTLLFDREAFTPARARAWAKKRGFRHGAGRVDVNPNTVRIRQHEPAEYRPSTFRTITLTDGVKAVVGVPVKAARAVRPAGYDTRGPRANPFGSYRGVPYYGTAGVYRVTLPGNTHVSTFGQARGGVASMRAAIDERLASTPMRKANPKCQKCNGEGQIPIRHADGLWSWCTCPACEGWGGSRVTQTIYPDGTKSTPHVIHPKKNPALRHVHDTRWFLEAVDEVAQWAKGLPAQPKARAVLKAAGFPRGGDRVFWAGEAFDVIQREASHETRVVEAIRAWLPFL